MLSSLGGTLQFTLQPLPMLLEGGGVRGPALSLGAQRLASNMFIGQQPSQAGQP